MSKLIKTHAASAKLGGGKLHQYSCGAIIHEAATLRATVVHSSISQHDSIEVSSDLTAAKRQAAKEFGMGFIDHTIRIYDAETREVISERRIGGRKWSR